MVKKIIENLLYKELSYRIYGAAIEVRKDFGPGHKEKLYQEALAQELTRHGIGFEKEKAIKIYSPKDGKYVGLYRPDFIVDKKIIIETKAEKFVAQDEIKRIYDYLRNSEYELAYLINFASPQLFVRRIIYTNNHKQFSPLKNANIKSLVAKTLLVFISLILVFVSGLPQANAAELELITKRTTINSEQRIEVQVVLNAEGEPINAIEGRLIWPENLLQLQEINDGNSIISFWLTKPSGESAGELNFAGVIPGGYAESGGLLFKAVLQAQEDGAAKVELADVRALISDGQGTAAQVKTTPLELVIASSTSLFLELEKGDIDKPEEFKPEVGRSEEIFGGKYFLSFAAQDKNSGIAYYEVQERARRYKLNELPTDGWQRAESPYELTDQSLKSYIYVRATDRANNQRVVEVRPIKGERLTVRLFDYIFYGIIILILIGGIALVWFKIVKPVFRLDYGARKHKTRRD